MLSTYGWIRQGRQGLFISPILPGFQDCERLLRLGPLRRKVGEVTRRVLGRGPDGAAHIPLVGRYA